MRDAVVIGAGPSGLAAADELARAGAKAVVVERFERVGGLARTLEHEGCRYDIGPHRFFTKNREVERLFQDVVAEDIVDVRRLTRILYRNKLFNYPLTPLNALFGVGVGSSFAILGSYASARLGRRLRPRAPENFEQWVSDQFGARLFRTFFKTYTEKVWGIPCDRIGADWASQRIKGLSLAVAIRRALFRGQARGVKTLVDRFLYPRLGAGQFYEKLRLRAEAAGGEVLTRRKTVRIVREGFRVRRVEVEGPRGREEIEAKRFLSSAPLTEMVLMMDPPPPPEVVKACRSLRYRDHIGVDLKLRGALFPDNWIYVHAKEVRMARIANYRNFSKEMADADDISPVTVEYFTFSGDDLWSKTDAELVELAAQELERVGLAKRSRLVSGMVVRSEKAYPVIEMGFQRHIDVIRAWLARFENLQPIGRSGMFKYNNQDHAIATGILAARTALGVGRFDPWKVNIDAEYHEEEKV